MEPKPVIYEVIYQCKPEVEEEHNTWVDDTHIPMLLQFKGLKRLDRYKLVSEIQPYGLYNRIDAPEGYSEYILILEFENWQDFEAYEASPERAAAIEEARTHDWHGLHEVKRRVQYELVKAWKR